LLKQIIGNVKPDSGRIIYNGVDLTKNTGFARSLVSIMPQFHVPLEGVSLKQSVEAMIRIKGASEQEVHFCTKQILKELEIEKWSNASGNKLSGGLQRLTSFAMTVAYPSDILLLDEPTNDVDPSRRKLVWKYMRKLAKRGHLVFVVTHNLLEVEQYADRYLLLDKGQMLHNASLLDKRKEGRGEY
jgi:ABC-2 type transport system ATP-binding protein